MGHYSQLAFHKLIDRPQAGLKQLLVNIIKRLNQWRNNDETSQVYSFYKES